VTGTRIADDKLATLVSPIAFSNAYNRLDVILKASGGNYKPGQWD